MADDFVAMGLNGPRTSAGASGFMSQRSILLGAPRLKIMMHARSSPPGFTAPGCRARRTTAAGWKPIRPQRPGLEEVTPRARRLH